MNSTEPVPRFLSSEEFDAVSEKHGASFASWEAADYAFGVWYHEHPNEHRSFCELCRTKQFMDFIAGK